MIRRIAKPVLRILLGDYEFYEIYALSLENLTPPDLSRWTEQGFDFRPITADDLENSADGEVRARAFYGGEGAHGFGVFLKAELVSLQWYWHGERYRQRNFWPLRDREAKSIELFTVDRYRGRGLATALKAYSAHEMQMKGFSRLISRIWHSNQPSRKVSEKLGWTNIAQVIVIYPLGIRALGIRRDRMKASG